MRRLEEVLMGGAGGSSSDGSDDDENVGDNNDGVVGDRLENLEDDWGDEKIASV